MSNTNKRTRRSPLELLTAQQEKLNALAAKVAQQTNADNPAIVALNEALNGLTKEIIGAQRMFSKGPQNLAQRRLSHELWISEINAQEIVAKATLDWAQNAKDDLAIVRERVLTQLSKGEPVNLASVKDGITLHLSKDAPLSIAQQELDEIRAHREASKKKAEKDNEGLEELASI